MNKKTIKIKEENEPLDNAESKISLQIEELQNEVESLKDSVLREKAENENLRKRTKKEVEEAQKFAISRFVNSLTEQVENLFRALENVDLHSDKHDSQLRNLYEGVEITKTNLLKVFKDYNIERIYPVNQIFDHKVHEAISQVLDSDKEANTIIRVIQAGYIISGRLLRPATVIVTKK